MVPCTVVLSHRAFAVTELSFSASLNISSWTPECVSIAYRHMHFKSYLAGCKTPGESWGKCHRTDIVPLWKDSYGFAFSFGSSKHLGSSENCVSSTDWLWPTWEQLWHCYTLDSQHRNALPKWSMLVFILHNPPPTSISITSVALSRFPINGAILFISATFLGWNFNFLNALCINKSRPGFMLSLY